MLMQPKYCSQNLTCELGKKTYIQCNANAHRIDKLKILIEDCDSLENCYSLRTSDLYIDKLLERIENEEEGELNDPSNPQPILVKGRIMQTSSSSSSLLDYDTKDNIQRAQSIATDDIESLDNGVTWLTRRELTVKQFYLVFCYASNEKGRDYSTKIIIPSDLDRGKTYLVDTVNTERPNDKELVVGDTFKLIFSYNNVLYSDKYNFVSKPESKCNGQIEDINIKNYTKNVQIPFSDVKLECSYNYSLELKVKNEKYFTESLSKPTNPIVAFSLNVLNFIIPSFLNSAEKESMTLIQPIGDSNSNLTELVVTYNDLKVKPDKTIELNCQARGRPKPVYRWTKDNVVLNVYEEKYKYDESGALKILRTHPSDSGNYECNVSNRFGFVQRSFNVDVESPIKAISEMSRKQVIFIVVISIVSFILFTLLLFAISYVLHQKRLHSQKLVNFCYLFILFYYLF
jgi:hypothetical protein